MTSDHRSGVVCPCCGWNGDEFGPGRKRPGRPRRQGVLCPRCGSKGRHRLLILFLQNETYLFLRPTRLLHFAPEEALSRNFAHDPLIDYVTTDIEQPDVTIQMDITDIVFPDESFDCILVSHVLEHVVEDRRAMRELLRVLRPDGFAVVIVPLFNRSTFEDPSIVTPEERERVFGQRDHVRFCGFDYHERLAEAGFDVSPLRYAETYSSEDRRRYGLTNTVFFICTKPNPSAAVTAEATAAASVV